MVYVYIVHGYCKVQQQTYARNYRPFKIDMEMKLLQAIQYSAKTQLLDS